MEKSLASWATVAGFILALSIGIWQAASVMLRLETRIESLEAQLSTISTGVALSNEAMKAVSPSSPNSLIVDPIKARCADLASQVAKAAQEGFSISTGRPIESLMERLGCFE